MLSAPLTALLIALLLSNAGCSTSLTRNHAETYTDGPAVLVAPTPETRVELARAVREALNGAPVRLANDALTKDSHLIIERIQPRDAAGRPFNGRSLEKPEQFQLFDRDGRCILVQARTGRQWRLRSATCAPVAQR